MAVHYSKGSAFPDNFTRRAARRCRRLCITMLRTRVPLRLRLVVLLAVCVFMLLVYAQPDVTSSHWQSAPVEPISTSDIASNLTKPGFLVWSPSCQIPDVDPFDESIRDLLKPVPPIKCSKWPPLTYTIWVDDEGTEAGAAHGAASGYVLRVDAGLLEKYVSDGASFSCCYSTITRFTEPPGINYTRDADTHINISSCTDFENEVKLKRHEEFILVQCKSYVNGQPNATRRVYVNMHAVVPIKPSVAEKMKETKQPDDDARLNILIVGFDAISRLNLLRTMPRTVAYLKRAGFIDLQGYNKVASNTLPNLMAILTGYSMDQIHNTCWPDKATKFDDCPFLWKEFHKHGYVTAFAEDEPRISTFNFHKTGFVNQPTDYYFRPYMLAGFKKLPRQKRHYMSVCMGPQTTFDHMMNYGIDFLFTFKNSRYFSIFWMNNFSHNEVNDAGSMDTRAFQLFNEISGTGIYNNTLVLFISDHGMRFGQIRKTHMGWFEERLPFIYMMLPPWFKTKYPKAYQNLLVNRNRLTSPYDLHATLKDISYGGLNKNSPTINASLACPKCKSLFAEEIGDRSCEDAGITPNWCTCAQFEDFPVNDTVVKNAAQYALGEIRDKLPSQCARLNMNQIVKANIKVNVNESDKDRKEFMIIFETQPGYALFETTVRRELSYENNYSIVGSIDRINAYRNQSYCVDDAELKPYCFCNPNSV